MNSMTESDLDVSKIHLLMCPASLLVRAERPIQHQDIASQKTHQVRLKGPTVAQSTESG